MRVELTRAIDHPVCAIEEAAANCYNSVPTDDGRIMKHCIRSGHTSVTEFAVFTFHIEGVSRALLAQLTRHRHASYAVRSQRYCKEDQFDYVKPKTIKENKNLSAAYDDFMRKIQQMYDDLCDLGIPNEDARYVLPNACCTELEMSINLRSLMNFCNERLCSCAQWEIRELAMQMRKCVVGEYPELEPYLVPKCEKYGKKYGFCSESKSRSCGRHPVISEIFEKNT